MSPKERTATVTDVKLIVAEVLADHVKDERDLRHDMAKHWSKVHNDMKKDIQELTNITAVNTKAISDLKDLFKLAAAVIGLIGVGWLAWVSVVVISQGNTISSQQESLSSMPEQIEGAVVRGIMEHFYPTDPN